jgi:aerobic carbon-monoxide dehydrogenase large subunit
MNILKYSVVEECGALINPMIAEGQLHGATLHGISVAIREEFVYDDTGQLITSTCMDHLKPTIKRISGTLGGLCHYPFVFHSNPTGAKGVGESGAIPAPAAIAAAVEDSLQPFGIQITELPLRPARIMEKIWQSQISQASVLAQGN